MVRRIQEFQVTTPAGTSAVNPLTSPLDFQEGIVRRVDLTFPDGCVGLVGARLAYAGLQLAPESTGSYTRGNDKTWSWDLDDMPTGTNWQLTTYNTDIYPHTLELHLYVDELPLAGTRVDGLPPGSIGGSSGGGAPTGDSGGDGTGGGDGGLPDDGGVPPDEGGSPPGGPPDSGEPPGGGTPGNSGNPPGNPPPPNPRGLKDMPGYVIHFGVHSTYFGCYASGIVRVLSAYEPGPIRNAGVPVIEASNAADFDRLLSYSNAAFGN